MLQNPLPLIEKGKYFEFDGKLAWSRKKQDFKISNKSKEKYDNHPYDSIGWYEDILNFDNKINKDHQNAFINIDQDNKLNNNNSNSSNGNNDEKAETHECKIDKKYKRCKICGIIMHKDYYCDSYNILLCPINYLLYLDNIYNKEDIQGITVINIKKPYTIQEMREYLLYNIGGNGINNIDNCNNNGYNGSISTDDMIKYESLNDNYKHRGIIPKKLKRLLTNRAIKNINDEDILKFDSNFESGNLMKVNFINTCEYDLYLNVDTNTHGNTQWFFFSVNIDRIPNKRVVFNIKNCYKSNSLFNDGMKIMIYSYKENQINHNVGWEFGGDNITYIKNYLKREAFIYVNNNSLKGLKDNNNQHDNSDDEYELDISKTINNVKNHDEYSSNAINIGKIYTRERSFTSGSTAIGSIGADNNNNNNNNSSNGKTRAKSKSTKQSRPINSANGQYTQNGNNSSINDSSNIYGDNNKLLNDFCNPNHHKQYIKKKKFPFYTLSFSYTFKHEYDKVLFAYSIPYTFTDMISCIHNIENILRSYNSSDIPNNDTFSNMNDYCENNLTKFESIIINTPTISYKREKLCNTLGGLPLYMLTITSNITNSKNFNTKLKARKGIFITGRVHPGESNSSFVMQGILKYLIGNTEEAKSLRNFFVFKIVPMMNPDGVAFGNNRTSFSGYDLNRKWNQPNEKFQPTIYYTKKAIANFKKEREILIFCDLHGHSKKKNSFIYGCNTASNGGFCSWTKVRLFPRIFARRSLMFSLKDCAFRITPDKLYTARVVVWKEFQVTNSFTLETSFFGYDYGDKIQNFTPISLEKLGTDFLLSLLEYIYVLADLTKELFLTNGWLKPSKLIQITGKPAAELLALKLKEEKEEEKRKFRIEKLLAEKKDFTLQKTNKPLNFCNIVTDNSNSKNNFKVIPNNSIKELISAGLNGNFQTNKLDIQNDELYTHHDAPSHKNFYSIQKNQTMKSFKITQKDELCRPGESSLLNQSADIRTIPTNLNASISDQDLKSPIDQMEFNNNINDMEANDIPGISSYKFPEPEQIFSQIPDFLENNDEDFTELSQFLPIKVEPRELEYMESVKMNESSIRHLFQERKDDWREYFGEEELQKNYDLIIQGQDPNNFEEISVESDSDPTDENAEKVELRKILLKNTVQDKRNKSDEKTHPLSTRKRINDSIDKDSNYRNRLEKSRDGINSNIKNKNKDSKGGGGGGGGGKITIISPFLGDGMNKVIKHDSNIIYYDNKIKKYDSNKIVKNKNNIIVKENPHQYPMSFIMNYTHNSIEKIHKKHKNSLIQSDINKYKYDIDKRHHYHSKKYNENSIPLAASFDNKNPSNIELDEVKNSRENRDIQPNLWIKSFQKPPIVPANPNQKNFPNVVNNIIKNGEDNNDIVLSQCYNPNPKHDTPNRYSDYHLQSKDKSSYMKAVTVQDTLQKNPSNLLTKANIHHNQLDLNSLVNFERGRPQTKGQNPKESSWVSPLELKYNHLKLDEALRKRKKIIKYQEKSFMHLKDNQINDTIFHDYHLKDNDKNNSRDHITKDCLNVLDLENEYSALNTTSLIDTSINKGQTSPIPAKKKEAYERKLKEHHLKPLSMFMEVLNDDKSKNYIPQKLKS